ncbi:MAG: hypothetical protein JWN50_477 [Parcubacteria group bacterium]|nr:hypothetical protein [Parcubacteria group bacterium]
MRNGLMREQAVSKQTAQYNIELGGSESMQRILEKRNDLVSELSAILRQAGIPGGKFSLNVTTTVKGTAHSKGLRIGKFVTDRRSVEVFWHPGSNDRRFQLLLTTPNGMNVERFHDSLVRAHDELEATKKSPNGNGKRDADDVPPIPGMLRKMELAPPSLPPRTLQVAMKTLQSLSPELGMVDRSECMDVLRPLGEPKAMLAQLTSAGHLAPVVGSDEMLRINKAWLHPIPAFSPTPPVSADQTPQPKASTEGSMGLPGGRASLAKLKSLMSLMEKAAERRENIIRIDGEIVLSEARLLEERSRLDALRNERESEVLELDDPALREAEAMLSLIQGALE